MYYYDIFVYFIFTYLRLSPDFPEGAEPPNVQYKGLDSFDSRDSASSLTELIHTCYKIIFRCVNRFLTFRKRPFCYKYDKDI